MQTVVSRRRYHALEPGWLMNKIRILIVDQYAAVRQALAGRLNTFPHLEVVGTTGNVATDLDQLCQLQPDVVLLELKGIKNHHPDLVSLVNSRLAGQRVGIIVLTSYADDLERERALHSGAHRYLLKDINTARLLDEIEAVAREAAGWPG